jgi:outer membrane protein insertion porin family
MRNRVLAASVALFIATAVLASYPVAPTVVAASPQDDAAPPAQDPSESKLVETVTFRDNRRIPDESMRLWVQTREGDPYSPQQIQRDLRTVLAQGYFADAKVFVEEGTRGGLNVIFEVKEYPVILQIDYPGLKSVTESDVLEEWRKRTIGLSKESQLDPVKAQRAAAAIKDLLAAKGRPDAVVKWVDEQISSTAVSLHFNVEEGARVRVAEIDFEGNTVFSDGELRGQMKLVKKAGLISGLTDKDIYYKEKLADDLERVRFYYGDHGYINAKMGEPIVTEAGPVGSGFPLIGGKDKGLKVTIPVDEGRRYRVGKMNIEGETVYPEETIKAVIGLKEGDLVRSSKIRKGVYEDLKKLYGERGYIQFEPIFTPDLRDDPNSATEGIADLNFQLEEGKSFIVRRIEFKGNTYTRDNVLRREIPLNEGDAYNQRFWDYSILKLNQLGYFNEIKDTDADIRTNDRAGTVDIDLRVQEKGRQQIQFTGGVSGIGGSFIGIQYSTNNLLGYGEAFSVNVSAGNRTKIFQVGLTEPYVLGRPISAGFQLFYSKYQYYGGGRLGQNFNSGSQGLFGGFGLEGEELFTQTSYGGTVSLSAPVAYFFRRSSVARFSRLGLSYTYRNNSIQDPAVNRDDDPNNNILVTYRQTGISQSTVVPTFTYNSLNYAGTIDPTRGQEFTLGLAFSGGPLGGQVKTIQPTVEYKFFHPLNVISRNPEKPDVFGFRLLAGHVRSFGSTLDTNSLSFIGGIPVFTRYFLGGEDTIRGFGVRTISPVARVERFVTTRDVSAVNLQGDALRVLPPRLANRRSIAPGVIGRYTVDTTKNAIDFFTPIGADTQVLGNFEYRIPIVGPVSMAAFVDIGSAFNVSSLDDQFTRSEFLPTVLSRDVFGNPVPLTLDPRGQFATPDEIADATTPETPPGQLPPGFRRAFILGEQQSTQAYRLSEDSTSLFTGYRYSVGAEFRVQVPVINVPFRLIFAYNPNARIDTNRADQVYLEERTVIRFSVGRTF